MLICFLMTNNVYHQYSILLQSVACTVFPVMGKCGERITLSSESLGWAPKNSVPKSLTIFFLNNKKKY